LTAGRDADLGAAGSSVALDNTRLTTQASFSTARDFNISAAGGTINTNGYEFGIDGKITAAGILDKEGAGVLALTGNNVWTETPSGFGKVRLGVVPVVCKQQYKISRSLSSARLRMVPTIKRCLAAVSS
jgi:hypothetical protein